MANIFYKEKDFFNYKGLSICSPMTNRIFLTDHQLIISENSRLLSPSELPTFEHLNIFFLETLGVGGFGLIQKAYDKSVNEYVVIKKFKNVLKDNEESIVDIMLEDALLESIERIRTNDLNNNQYFLKYYGVFKDQNDETAVILKMENGCATLDNILESGKVYSCAELIYVQKKILKGLAILEKNGIAHRDIKPQNIVLVEDPSIEGKFFYKISDFGVGCQVLNNNFLIPSDSLQRMTEIYAAPEIVKLFDQSSRQAQYNPFIADVYSLGLISLKMINRTWGKTELKNGLLSMKEKFKDYDPILDLLKGMLEEDPQKRWDFKKILRFYRDNEAASQLVSKAKTDEANYWHKWQVEFKEKIKEKTPENLEILYEEHKTLYIANIERITRPNEAKFHLDRASEILEKIKERNEKNANEKTNESQKNWEVFERTIFCWKSFGYLFLQMGNLELSEQYLNKSLKGINDWKLKLEVKDTEKNRDDEKNKIIIGFEGDVLDSLGILYQNMGNLLKGEEFLLNSLAISQNLFGENHYDVVMTMNHLGSLYDNMRKISKAEEFYTHALKINKNLFGENHSNVAMSLNNLGILYDNHGNFIKAEEFYLKSLKIYQNCFGENNSDVAALLNHLGSLYDNMGNVEKSEEFLLKSLKIRRNLFGKNHSNVYVASSMNNLGILYDNMDNKPKAEEFYLKSLKIYQNVLGENHSYVATLLNNLGLLFKNMDDLQKAEEFYLKSLEIRQKLFGKNHSSVANSMSNIGLLYQNMGNLQKAEEFLLESLKIHQNISTENHSDVANSLMGLGCLYEEMGKYEKAEEFYLKSLKIYQNLFGEINYNVATALKYLGNLYKKMENISKTEEFYLLSLKMFQTLFGENNSDVAMLLNNLSFHYELIKNPTLAIQNAKKAYEIGLELLGELHPETIQYLEHYKSLSVPQITL